MLKNAIVWRESVYKGDFKSNRCGSTLTDNNNNPKGSVIVASDKGKDYLICPKCKNTVGRVEKVDVSNEQSVLLGNWENYNKK